MDAVCRLCLSENVNVIYVFESKGIPGWTAADGIRELLRIPVSADDIYPRCVCNDCMGKLEDFKLFKERCENSKDLLDRAFAGKRGVGRDEIQDSEGLMREMISLGSGVTPDHTPLLQIKMESDVDTPCTMTGGDSLIASEDEVELEEEEERDPLGDLNDVKPSVSQLNGAFTEVKEELCEEGSNHECSGEVETLPQMEGSDGVPQVKQGCSNGSVPEISTAFSRSSDKGNNDPLDTTSLTFTLKREECEVMLSDTSSHNKPRESAQKNDTEQDIASYVQSDVGERANRTADLRALRPHRHMSRKEVNDAGGNAENGGQVEEEMRTGGTLQHNLEGTDNRFMCNMCGMCFADESNLRKHIESQFGEKMSKSEVYSGKELVGRDSLVCAKESIDGKSVLNLKSTGGCKEWTCIVCQKVFKVDGNVRLHEGETSFICDECDTGFNHIKNRTPPTKTHSGDTYKCEECGKEFAKKSYLRVHLRIHSTERPFECDICGKGFKLRIHLLVHSKIHSDEKPFKCNECGRGFIKKNVLTVHLRLHTGERPFKCDICNKGFICKGILTVHSKIHSDGTYKCEQCGKWFATKSNLAVHLRIHAGERPFKCDVCDKRFRQRGHLVVHSKIHTNDKPHKCNVCGKGFVARNKLVEHSRVHTGERPYKCDMCDKRFTSKCILTAHSKFHSGDTHKCEQCGKVYITRTQLNRHLQTHTTKRPFKCDMCHKQFRLRCQLLVHSKFHSNGKPYKCNEVGSATAKKFC